MSTRSLIKAIKAPEVLQELEAVRSKHLAESNRPGPIDEIVEKQLSRIDDPKAREHLTRLWIDTPAINRAGKHWKDAENISRLFGEIEYVVAHRICPSLSQPPCRTHSELTASIRSHLFRFATFNEAIQHIIEHLGRV